MFLPYYDFYAFGGFYHGVSLRLIDEANPLDRIQVRTLDYRTGKLELSFLFKKEPAPETFEAVRSINGEPEKVYTVRNGKLDLDRPDLPLWSPDSPAVHTLTAKIGGVTLSGAGFDSESNGVYAVTLKKTQKVTKGRLKGGTNVWVAELMIDTTAGWDACQMAGDYYTYNTKMPSMTAPAWISAQRNPFACDDAKAVAAAVAKSGKKGVEKFALQKAKGDHVYDLVCASCMVGGKAALTATAKANGTVALAGKIGTKKVSGTAVLDISPEHEEKYDDIDEYDNPIEVTVRVRTATARFFSGNFVIEIVYAIESDEDGTYVNAAGKVWKK